MWFLLLTLLQPRNASGQSGDHEDQTHDDLLMLKLRLDSVQAQQQQMLDELNEIKRLISIKSSAQPNPQLLITLDVHGERFEGSSAARIAIIEYSDFECPFCGLYEREISPQIFDNYIRTGKVKLFYRDFPLPMHPRAVSAARAAKCAGDQGKFWEMQGNLFANQMALSDAALLDRAKTLGLNTNRFTDCLSSGKYADDIRRSVSEGQQLGIQGTPMFFFGTISPSGDVVKVEKRIMGARPYDDFKSALDELLASNKADTLSTH